MTEYATNPPHSRHSPAGSWDCHVHVLLRSPDLPPAGVDIDPDETTLPDLVRVHGALGIARAVIVQPLAYRTDTRVLQSVLRAGHGRFRGIAMIDDSISDHQLEQLHEAGVRGIRFSFTGSPRGSSIISDFERACARIFGLGWHVKILARGPQLLELEPLLRRVKIPAVLDHMSMIAPRAGLDEPALRLMLDLLCQPNWWVLLSNGDRTSKVGPPWNDVIPIIQLMAAAAPDRSIWATDWPHLRYSGDIPRQEDLVTLLIRAVPDLEQRCRILVGNPTRLYDGDRRSADT